MPRFSADGTSLVVHRADRIEAYEVSGALRWAVDAGDVLDFCPVGNEVWIIGDRPLAIRKRARDDGRVIGDDPLDHLDPHGWLAVSSAVPTLAIWCGTPIRPLRIEPPVHPDAGFAMPLAEQRWLAWDAGTLRLWRPIGDAWRVRAGDPRAPIIDGQVILDGRAFAFVQRRSGSSELRIHVVSTRDGSPHATLHLQDVTEARFAARRGYVVARTSERLIVFDLRFGRLVGQLALPDGTAAFAIDDGLRSVALIGGDGSVRVVPPESLATSERPDTAATTAPSDVAPSDVEPAPPAPAPIEIRAPASADVDDEPFPVEPLWRFDPVVEGPLATTTEIAEALEARMRWIGARALAAIADAWNTGRLVHGDPDGLPFADEVAGILRLSSGLAVDKVTDAVGRVEAATAVLAEVDRRRSGRATPLDILVRDFGLSLLAEQILLVVCGPQLRGDYARLYGILANDPSRTLIDEQLVCQVLAGPAAPQIAAIARELDADQPLRKYGMIEVGAGLRLFAALTVDPVVLRLIANQPAQGAPESNLQVRTADRTLDQLQLPRALLREALRFLGRSEHAGLARIVVRGRTGCGRHAMLAALAARAGRALAVIDTSTMPRERGELGKRLTVMLRRGLLRGLVPCVDGLELISDDDPDTKLAVAAILRDHPGPLAIRLPARARVPIDPGYCLLDVPSRTESERSGSWMIALTRHAIPLDDASDLAARYRVGPGVIERVCEQVARKPERPTTPQGWAAGLDATVRQHLENRLGTTANRVDRLASWAEVVLPEDILDSLLELTARVRHRKRVFETWGFDAAATNARGITALFSGGPGTGKTMVAGVIAHDLGLELYRIDVARITSKWIGETEKNLGSVFDAAEDGQVMLLFDEADSLFARRTEVKSSVDRYANMEVNYLLQRLDSFEGMAILTTNFGTSIDPAFKRRLSFRVTFPFPDEEMRERLWKTLIPSQMPIGGALDFARLAQRFKLSGGYIRNAALRAAFLAAEEDAPLMQEHLERAIRMEFREIGKLADSGVLE